MQRPAIFFSVKDNREPVSAAPPIGGKTPDEGLPSRFEADPFVSPEGVGLTDQVIAVDGEMHEMPFHPSAGGFPRPQEFVVAAKEICY